MSGITFMVDEHGAKTAAVVDLRKHGRVWEDFYDALRAQARTQEPRETLAAVKNRLKLPRQRNG